MRTPKRILGIVGWALILFSLSPAFGGPRGRTERDRVRENPHRAVEEVRRQEAERAKALELAKALGHEFSQVTGMTSAKRGALSDAERRTYDRFMADLETIRTEKDPKKKKEAEDRTIERMKSESLRNLVSFGVPKTSVIARNFANPGETETAVKNVLEGMRIDAHESYRNKYRRSLRDEAKKAGVPESVVEEMLRSEEAQPDRGNNSKEAQDMASLDHMVARLERAARNRSVAPADTLAALALRAAANLPNPVEAAAGVRSVSAALAQGDATVLAGQLAYYGSAREGAAQKFQQLVAEHENSLTGRARAELEQMKKANEDIGKLDREIEEKVRKGEDVAELMRRRSDLVRLRDGKEAKVRAELRKVIPDRVMAKIESEMLKVTPDETVRALYTALGMWEVVREELMKGEEFRNKSKEEKEEKIAEEVEKRLKEMACKKGPNGKPCAENAAFCNAASFVAAGSGILARLAGTTALSLLVTGAVTLGSTQFMDQCKEDGKEGSCKQLVALMTQRGRRPELPALEALDRPQRIHEETAVEEAGLYRHRR